MNGKQCKQFMASQSAGLTDFETLQSCGFSPNVFFRATCEGISDSTESAFAVRSLLTSIEMWPDAQTCSARSPRRPVAFGVRRLVEDFDIWQLWIDCSEAQADCLRRNAPPLWDAMVGGPLAVFPIDDYYDLPAALTALVGEEAEESDKVERMLSYFAETKLGFAEAGLKVRHFFYPTPSFASHKRQTEAAILPVPEITRERTGTRLSN